jgi:hypothetical protein
VFGNVTRAWHYRSVYLAKAAIELQAGVLPSREFPRLANEALAAGNEGETLRALAPLIGESTKEIHRAAEAIPGVELRLVAELGLPERSPREARWALAQLVATQIATGEIAPDLGASELLGYVRDDPELLAATGDLETAVYQWEFGLDRQALAASIIDEAQRIAAADLPDS